MRLAKTLWSRPFIRAFIDYLLFSEGMLGAGKGFVRKARACQPREQRFIIRHYHLKVGRGCIRVAGRLIQTLKRQGHIAG